MKQKAPDKIHRKQRLWIGKTKEVKTTGDSRNPCNNEKVASIKGKVQVMAM